MTVKLPLNVFIFYLYYPVKNRTTFVSAIIISCNLFLTCFHYQYTLPISAIFLWRFCFPFIFVSSLNNVLEWNHNLFCVWSPYVLTLFILPLRRVFPGINYIFKVKNRNTRTRCELCSKLTIKTPERSQWRRSAFFIDNLEHITHLALVFLLLPLSRLMRAGLFLYSSNNFHRVKDVRIWSFAGPHISLF